MIGQVVDLRPTWDQVLAHLEAGWPVTVYDTEGRVLAVPGGEAGELRPDELHERLVEFGERYGAHRLGFDGDLAPVPLPDLVDAYVAHFTREPGGTPVVLLLGLAVLVLAVVAVVVFG